ncbi:hypothetical protein K488DRAFT_90180 [Vararia minispora EC-137]|uniref:Uncharacterized protein n=1 Tax=Vararia minispora EC-137 TaxID=1314806 RepID=A0ACB8Q8W1_9AGAM|nr:hypothetical protein K488DRAFT_90180 [Vararia minispora EC-137]
MAVIVSPTRLLAHEYFREDFDSTLPYIFTRKTIPEMFGEVMADEEHIIMIKSREPEALVNEADHGELHVFSLGSE